MNLTTLLSRKIFLSAVLVLFAALAHAQVYYTPVTGSTTTILVPSSGYTAITDDGGPGGYDTGCGGIGVPADAALNYSNCGCATVITVCPDNLTDTLKIDFDAATFSVNGTFDYVDIYNGNSIAAPLIYTTSTSTALNCGGPGIVTATSPSGCITVSLYASAVVNDPGFIGTIILVAPTANDIAATAITPSGQASSVLQNAEVVFTNAGLTQVDSFQYNWAINGAPQGGGTYVGALATGASTPSIVLGQFTPANGDVLSAWSSMPNNIADGNAANDTISTTLCLAMTGSFTVDATQPASGSNFQTIQAAVDSMAACGIAGPVVFDVVSGTGPYVGAVRIPEIAGASAINTITFNGNGNTVSATPVSSQLGIVTLDGADWVTLDSFSITSSSTTLGIGVAIINGANDNTISNNRIDLSGITSTSTLTNAGIAITPDESDAYDTGGPGGSRNLISGNTCDGGYYGVVIGGNAAGGSDSNTVLNNTVSDFYSYGILVEDADFTQIIGNDISRIRRTSVGSFYGIEMEDNTNGSLIANNLIHNTHTSATTLTGLAYGIYSDGADSDPLRPNVYVNNIIYEFDGNGTVYGIYNFSSDNQVYYHNTVSIDFAGATAGTTRGFYQTITATGVEFKNNIVSVTRGGTGAKYAIYFGSTASSITSENNILYVNSLGSGTQGLGYLSSTQSTLADWQTASGQDLLSLEIDPQFVSIGGGDFTPTSGFVNNAGGVVNVPVDIFGNARNISAPDPGAIEFAGIPNDVGVVTIDSPLPVTTATPQPITVTVRNYGSNAINTVDVYYAINGGAPQGPLAYATLIAVGDDATGIVLNPTYTPAPGDQIRAWTRLPNGVNDGFNANDTATLDLCIAMTGNFTIDASLPNSGTNFQSFQLAVDSLSSCGIAGPVVFDVNAAAGPYVGQVLMPEIAGASSVNTITFSGHGAAVSAAPPSSSKGVFTLDGADWVRFDSLNFVSTDALYGIGLLLTNSANDNIVTNCGFDLSAITSTSTLNSAGIAITNSLTSPGSSGNNGARNRFENNNIRGAYYGVTVYGNSAGGSDSNQVLNNTIADFYAYGVVVEDCDYTLVQGNDISRGGRTSVGSFYGIEIDDNTNGTLVNANRIHNSHTSASSLTGLAYGIYSIGADSDPLRPNLYTNNLVYELDGNGTVYGIYNSSSDHQLYYHNTVSLDYTPATGGITRGFYQLTTATGIEFKNNIVSVTRGGSGSKNAIYFGSTASSIAADNNVYYVNSAGSGTQGVGYLSSNQVTLADWQLASAVDSNSLEIEPVFNSPASGDFTPGASAINDIGDSLNVATDILGASRDLSNPDPGAFEFTPLPFDAGVIAATSPLAPLAPGAYDIEAVYQNFGLANLNRVQLYGEIFDGTNTTVLGPIQLNDTLVSLETDTVVVGNFNFTPGSYTIRLWTSNPNNNADANTVNDTFTYTICTALAGGNYTIDSRIATGGSNYASFTDAAAALQCGILGNVVFTVQYGSGPYNEQVTIDQVLGAGPLATVVFDGQDADSTVLTHDANVQYATFLLNGADYVTITNMTINATDANNGFGVMLTNDANYNTVSNTIINLPLNFIGAVESGGVVASASLTTHSSTGINANYTLVENNVINGGEFSIRFNGISSSRARGNRIINNFLRDADDGGIYTNEQDSLIVNGNNSVVLSTTADAIYLLNTEGYYEVIGNYGSAGDWALYVFDGNVTGGNGRAKIINNYFYSSADYAMYLNDVDSTDVYHNTSLGEPGIRLDGGCDGMDVRNNIFVSTTDYAYEHDDNDTYVALDYNIYYSDAANAIRFNPGSVANYADLAAWQAAVPTLNINSLYGLPTFVNAPDDLHLLGTFGNDVGDNSVGVSVDYDGDTRPQAPSTTVDIGADEFTPAANDMALTAILSPVSGTCGDSVTEVTVVVFNNGTAPQTGFDITVDVTGALTTTLTNTYAPTIAPGTTDTVVVGTINTYAGGAFNFTAFTALAGDAFTANDTALLTGVNVLNIPDAPVTFNDTGCVGETFTLSIDSVLGGYSEVNWYDSTGSNLVGTGNTFTTPVLNTNTTYYAQGSNTSFDRMGRPAPAVAFAPPTSGNTFITNTNGWGVNITLFQDVFIDSVTVYPNGGTGTLNVEFFDKNNGNVLVYTAPTFNITGAFGPIQIPIGVLLPAGFYNVGLEFTGSFSLIRESGAGGFPYVAPSGIAEVTEGALGFTSPSTSTGYWFYDFVLRVPGCESPLTAAEAIISTPVADAGADATICVGETATLTAVGGADWEWNTNETTQSISASPTTTTPYSVVFTDQYGCESAPDTAVVIVNALPVANAGPDVSTCAGAAVTLTASGGTGYAWSNNAQTASTTVSPIADATYTVTVTDANGCSATDEVEVSAIGLPTGNAPADTTICLGSSATLTATGGVTYLWSTSANVPSISVGPTSDATYSVTTTDANGCQGVDSVTVFVQSVSSITFDLPADTACIDDAPISLVGTPAGGVFSGVGVTNGQFIPADVGLGSYTVRYTVGDNLGCAGSVTDNIVITANNCITTGLTDIGFIADLTVYPNPFNSRLTIDLMTTETGVIEIRVLDLLGKEVMVQEELLIPGNNQYVVEPSDRLAEGFYVVELRSGTETFQLKVLKAQ